MTKASINDIEFEGEESSGLINLNILINNKPINVKGLLFQCEPKFNIAENSYQLHIVIPHELRQNGIAEKLYTVFLMKYGNIISLNSNRVSKYAEIIGKNELGIIVYIK